MPPEPDLLAALETALEAATGRRRGPVVNAECRRCGVTAADLPYEELGLDLDTASELLFDGDLCQGCAQLLATAEEDPNAT